MARKDTLKASAAIPAPAPAEVAAPKGKASRGVKNPPVTEPMGREGVREGTLLYVDPNKIEVEPGYNVPNRDLNPKDEEDADFIRSIRANGIITPLEVRYEGKHIYVTAGHRRLSAIKAILKGKFASAAERMAITERLARVPAVLEAPGMSVTERMLRIATSNQGKPLSAMQRGVLWVRLREAGWPMSEIAARAGKSTKTVENDILLSVEVGNKPEIGKAIATGKLKETLALDVIKTHREKAGEVIAAASAEADKQVGLKAGKITAATVKAVGATVSPSHRERAKMKDAEAAKPAARQTAAPAVRTGKLPDDGTTADLDGPFVAMGADVWDVHGHGIASCDGIPIARAIVAMLNRAWEGRAPARASSKPAATPAEVPAAHVAARRGKPAVRTSRGR